MRGFPNFFFGLSLHGLPLRSPGDYSGAALKAAPPGSLSWKGCAPIMTAPVPLTSRLHGISLFFDNGESCARGPLSLFGPGGALENGPAEAQPRAEHRGRACEECLERRIRPPFSECEAVRARF